MRLKLKHVQKYLYIPQAVCSSVTLSNEVCSRGTTMWLSVEFICQRNITVANVGERTPARLIVSCLKEAENRKVPPFGSPMSQHP